MIHGSSRVNSLYRRLCTLHTTSCATYLPTLYTKSIASVPIQLRHGACFVETMLVYMEGCSEKIGGPIKTVKNDESKFDRFKYRGHPVKGQWVFGAVERESSKTFLIPILDRTADTLMAFID